MTINKLLFAFLFLTLIGAGCKKDSKLSEFIIGKWTSQEFMFFDSQSGSTLHGYFTVTFSSNNTVVATQTISAGSKTSTGPVVRYKINNTKDQMTLDQTFLDPSGTRVYNVLWRDNGNLMSWSPADGTSQTAFFWTKI